MIDTIFSAFGKKKSKLFVPAIFLTAALATSCSKGTEPQETNLAKTIAVNVQEIKTTENTAVLNYTGTVVSKNMTNYSFKSSARLKKLYVSEGQFIKAGDMLAELDKEELGLNLTSLKAQLDSAKAGIDSALAQLNMAESSVQAAQASINSSQAQYEKGKNGASAEAVARAKEDVTLAQTAYDTINENNTNLVNLYGAGTISKIQLDESKLKLKEAETNLNKANEVLKEIENGMREEDLRVLEAGNEASGAGYSKALEAKSQANAAYKAAISNYDAIEAKYDLQASLIHDSVLYAYEDGAVSKVLFEETEIVPAGNPVVIMRGNAQVVDVGVTSKDLFHIHIGGNAEIKTEHDNYTGIITSISEIPDHATQTYTVEVTVPDSTLKLGMLADVSFDIGVDKGIWIPIDSIYSDGEDYVFVVKDHRAFKKTISLETMTNDLVKVSGVSEGDCIVIKGMTNLSDGGLVHVLNGEENNSSIKKMGS